MINQTTIINKIYEFADDYPLAQGIYVRHNNYYKILEFI
jgi:hypothetical protein